MGVDARKIRVEMKRIAVISIKTCYRSVRRHPFLVGFLCFLLLLYGSFPFLFSLLLSASPILVCTAILLGTLLSFGEPNIPEIEKEKEEEEEEVTREISSLKTGVVGDATVVVDEKDENCLVENFVGKRDVAEAAIREESWEESKVNKIESDVEADDALGGYALVLDENSRDIQFKKKEVIESDREFDLVSENREIHMEKNGTNNLLSDGEATESHFSLIPNGENESLLHVDGDKFPGGSVEAEHDRQLDTQHSSWKRVNGDDEDEDEDASDSGSDGAESSSPDASMADIIPMLDELHPLLNEEASQPAQMSNDGSDSGSERSPKEEESSGESDEDNQVDGDDDNDNEEEETQRGKEDESKCAIKWTEDDEKNLMDLGTSELERNLRLESLIARRRARKSTRTMAEKNLIDLDGVDLPFNVPPISTTRRNPFDLPFDDVPGSAPSILLQRQNPFDLPYDSSEEKPDLKGDSFQEEFSTAQHPEQPFFRRHESFHVGPSTFGASRQERQDLRWKPYFIPERFATEETSYRTFQRQLSEASESKLSSVPDTESVSSAVEEEDKKVSEEDGSQEAEMISSVDHASILVQHGSLSSEDVDSLDIENVMGREAHHVGDEITLGDVEDHHELDSSLSTSGAATPIESNTSEILLRMEPGEDYSSRSSISSLSEVDERISDVKGLLSPEQNSGQTEESHISMQTSSDTDFQFMSMVGDENQQRELNLEQSGDPGEESVSLVQRSFDSDFQFTRGVENSSSSMEPALEPIHDHAVDSGISTQASIDSDSHFMGEVIDNDLHEQHVLEPSVNHISESGISTQTSVDSDFHFTSGAMDDNQHKEPVYDSSPQAADKLLSFLSSSSDAQGETLDIDSPPTLAEFSGKEGFSREHSIDECELRSRDLSELEHEVAEIGLTGDNGTFAFKNDQNGLAEQDLGIEHHVVDLPPSSSNNGFVKVDRQDEPGQIHLSSLDAETMVVLHQDGIEKLDFISSSSQVASAETIMHAVEEPHPSTAVENSEESKLSSSASQSLEEIAGEELDSLASGTRQMPFGDLKLSANEELLAAVSDEQVLEANMEASSSEVKDVQELSLTKENLMHSSSSEAILTDPPEDADVKLVSSGSSYQHLSSDTKSSTELETQLSWLDKAVVEPSLCDHDESQEPPLAPAESMTKAKITNSVDVPEVFDHETSIPASAMQENLEYKPRAGEVDFSDNVLDKIVYEDSGNILEGPSYSAEAHVSSEVEDDTSEDEDEIKEIDEGLLSELDTVGDFRVKEVVGESLHDEQIHSRDYNLLLGDSSQPETNSELPVLEVRSVTDIDLAFKQIHGGVDIEEFILPSMIADETRSYEETNSDMQAIEASSSEDIYIAVRQASEGSTGQKSKQSNFEEGPLEINELGSSSSAGELPVLEIRTINDIDVAFKQISEGVDVEEVILPSTIEQHGLENDSRDTQQSSTDLPVVEVRSLEDLDIITKQASEENIKEIAKLVGLNEGVTEVKEVGSSNSTTELPVLEFRTANDIDLAFKQLSEGADVEEVIIPSAFEQHGAPDSNEGVSDVNEVGSSSSAKELPVLEFKTAKDIDVAFKQLIEGAEIEEVIIPSTFEQHAASDLNEGVGSSSSAKELPVLEVRTIDDIDLAFKQLSEGADIVEVILPSTLEQHAVMNEPGEPQQSSSDMPVLEARSLEELHIAMKQVPEGNVEEPAKSSHSMESRDSEVWETNEARSIKLSTDEATEVGCIQKTESSTEESGAQKTSNEVSHLPKDRTDEISETSNLNNADAKDEKTEV